MTTLSEGDTKEAVKPVFHERQTKARCAMHALNNLYQEAKFGKEDMDKFCYQLNPDAWINPHKSMFGVGNYDINVVSAATATTGHVVKWFDKRKSFESVCLENVLGFILNTESKSMLGLFTSHHWFTVRRVNHVWYDLNSSLKSPAVIPDLSQYMAAHLALPQSHLMIILPATLEDSLYLPENNNNNNNNTANNTNNTDDTAATNSTHTTTTTTTTSATSSPAVVASTDIPMDTPTDTPMDTPDN